MPITCLQCIFVEIPILLCSEPFEFTITFGGVPSVALLIARPSILLLHFTYAFAFLMSFTKISEISIKKMSRRIYANKLPLLFDLFTYFAEKVGKSKEK
jgi:hypothetical protein